MSPVPSTVAGGQGVYTPVLDISNAAICYREPDTQTGEGARHQALLSDS